MAGDYTKLYVHCVWCTWDRLPLLTEEVENLVCAAIVAKCRELGCRVIALNAVVDHVHLLVEMPPALSVSRLVAQVKGVSSHLVCRRADVKTPFRWSGTYAAFTVDSSSVERIAEYIRRQKQHHAEKFLEMDWEPQEVMVPLDERQANP